MVRNLHNTFMKLHFTEYDRQLSTGVPYRQHTDTHRQLYMHTNKQQPTKLGNIDFALYLLLNISTLVTFVAVNIRLSLPHIHIK